MNEQDVVARYRERQEQIRKQRRPEVVDKPPQQEEEEEENDLDPGRLAAAIGFETSVGLATDVASSFLGFAPPVYALANFVSGAGANAIAQFIRGERGVNLGEILSAGAVGIIPGSTIQTGKNLSKFVGKAGTLKRAALAGGVQAVGGEAIRIGIDEKRLLSVKEALLGGAIGGTASSGLQKILNTSPQILDTLGTQLARSNPFTASGLGFGPQPPRPPRQRSLTGPLNIFQGPSGSGPTGKITARNLRNLDSFLSGQTTSLDRTTAGLIQNPNFKLGDFLEGVDEELERVRAQYPNIDVDTNLQRFKWQWHHLNPNNMPADFYVGLNNVADRDLITDTLLRETSVSAGMNPSNRIGLPTEVHDEITNWLNDEIGRRSEVITQKISDDFGFGLTLTGPGSRAAKLRFNQLFAQVPVQQRIPYIIEYGQKISESSAIIAELMNQFDIFYDIPNGYRLDIDVNTMERMLSRLDEGLPSIRTLREIIEEVTDGMRIPVSDDLGRQGVAVPRDPNLIRAIDIEGMLRDHKAGQSVLNPRQIRSLQKELNEIYQMNLDIKGASMSAYIRAWYNQRFGGTRRSGTRTGPN